MGTVVYVDEQKMPRLDCIGARADLDLRCPQNAYGPFSRVAHHFLFYLLIHRLPSTIDSPLYILFSYCIFNYLYYTVPFGKD